MSTRDKNLTVKGHGGLLALALYQNRGPPSGHICGRFPRVSAVLADLDGEALGLLKPLNVTIDLEAAMGRIGTSISLY